MASTQLQIVNFALIKLGAKTITDVGGAQKSAEAANEIWDRVRDDVLCAHPWGFAQRRAELDYVVATISAATAADPVVVTVGDISSFADKALVEITHVDGMTDLNNTVFMIDNINTTNKTCELFEEDPVEQDDVAGTDTINTHNGIDGSGYSAWTANGQMRRIPKTGYAYMYGLPSDCLKPVSLCDVNGRTRQDIYFQEVEETKLITNLLDAFLIYTKTYSSSTTTGFTPRFENLLAIRLAVELAPALKASPETRKGLMDEYIAFLLMAQTSDANENPRDYRYTDPWIRARG